MSFDDFINNLSDKDAEKRRREAEKPQRKTIYLASIKQAQDQILLYLKPYIDANKVEIKKSSTYSSDTDLGHVEVPVLTVSAGGRGAAFTPNGSVGFGINCFIEVTPTSTAHRAGPNPKATIVRRGHTGDISDWKILIPEFSQQIPGRPSPVPENKSYEFTLENIQTILQRMMS